jgi:hypothetical protein
MLYIVLFACVISFLTLVAWLDPSHRRRLLLGNAATRGHGKGPMAESIAAIAAATVSRFGGRHGPVLRVPSDVLNGGRLNDRPCLTPVDCVKDKQCAGHCGCR